MSLGIIVRGVVVRGGLLSYRVVHPRVVHPRVVVPRVVVLGVVVKGVVVLEPKMSCHMPMGFFTAWCLSACFVGSRQEENKPTYIGGSSLKPDHYIDQRLHFKYCCCPFAQRSVNNCLALPTWTTNEPSQPGRFFF